MYQTQFVATSSADWAAALQLIDTTTNQPYDIPAGATFELDVDGCALTRSTDDGTIETPGNGVVQWRFPVESMRGLCRDRTYPVGLVMVTDGGTTQLLVGTLTLLDGEVR